MYEENKLSKSLVIRFRPAVYDILQNEALRRRVSVADYTRGILEHGLTSIGITVPPLMTYEREQEMRQREYKPITKETDISQPVSPINPPS